MNKKLKTKNKHDRVFFLGETVLKKKMQNVPTKRVRWITN